MVETAASHYVEQHAWFIRQLDEAGWTREESPTVRYIVEQFLGMGVIKTHRDTPEFLTALDIINDLLRGRALAPDQRNPQRITDDNDEDAHASWLRVQPGYVLNRQDRVRVTSDAYDGDLGIQHNGRMGSIMDVRYGMAIVHYDGEPAGVGHHHNIRLLEKRLQAPMQ